MLNKRQKHIIDFLNDSDSWITGKELASILNVTDRTIRSDIDAINNFYNCSLIEANNRLGYHIDEILLSKQDIETKEIIPQTSHERCVWLIHELLFKQKKINLVQLQDRVFVSDYSIENDLKKVRQLISQYKTLKLERSKNQICLTGDEADKRKLYKKLLTEETKGNFMNINSIANLWSNFDLLKVKDIFEEICEEYNYQIKEVVFPMIMIHAGVAIERIINKNYVHSSSVDPKLKLRKEYKISYDFFKRISEEINVEMVDDEISLFALLLLGKSSTEYRELNNVDVEELIDKVIEHINEFFDINFTKDWDLRVGLTTHIHSLLERVDNHVSVTNLYLKEIKRKYPLIFEMAVHSGEVISSYANKTISENELAFLALHLGAAYERVNAIRKYKAVALIPNNQMLSKACVDKLNYRFHDRMEIVDVLSFFEENMILKHEPDLIISTVELKHQLNIPTLHISLFVDLEDESKVFNTLNIMDKNRYKEDFEVLLRKLIRKDLFHVKDTYSTSEQAIHALCDELIEKGLATSQYKLDVFRREMVSATSFVYGFAVPHSISVSTNESCISTLILKKPVKWGDFEVKLIILLAIRETDNHLLKVFFDWLSNIVTDTKKFANLLEVSTHEEFIDLILN